MSEATPLSQLNSWDMTSQQNAVRKQRGWVMLLVRGGVLPCSEWTKKEGEMLSPSCCIQSINCQNPLMGVLDNYFPTGTFTGIGTSVSSLKHAIKSTTKKKDYSDVIWIIDTSLVQSWSFWLPTIYWSWTSGKLVFRFWLVYFIANLWFTLKK